MRVNYVRLGAVTQRSPMGEGEDEGSGIRNATECNQMQLN